MARYEVCPSCDTYTEITISIDYDNPTEVCDTCYDRFIEELYSARAKWQQEFEQSWVKRQQEKRQNEIDTAREESWYQDEEESEN